MAGTGFCDGDEGGLAGVVVLVGAILVFVAAEEVDFIVVADVLRIEVAP